MSEPREEGVVRVYPLPDGGVGDPDADLPELCACKGYQEYCGPLCCMYRGRGQVRGREKITPVVA